MASTIPNRFRNVSVSNTALLVAAGSKVIVGWNLINTNSTSCFLKIYNAATAGAVIVGTTIPIVTLMIPAAGLFFLSNEDKFQVGLNLGIVVAVTTGIADTDNTAPVTGCLVEISYANNN